MVVFHGKYDDSMSDHRILGYPVFRQTPFVCMRLGMFSHVHRICLVERKDGTTEMFQRTCCRWFCRAKRTFAQYSSTISNPYAVQPHLTWSRNHVINCSQKKNVFLVPAYSGQQFLLLDPKKKHLHTHFDSFFGCPPN